MTFINSKDNLIKFEEINYSQQQSIKPNEEFSIPLNFFSQMI